MLPARRLVRLQREYHPRWWSRLNKVLSAVNSRVSLPSFIKLPLPLITPAKVFLGPLRSNVNLPLSATLPMMLPVVPPLPICSVPILIVVPPMYVLFPVRINVPLPACTKAPAPVTTPPKVTESLRPNAKVPLFVILPTMLPVVPPLPICSVHALMVVPPK